MKTFTITLTWLVLLGMGLASHAMNWQNQTRSPGTRSVLWYGCGVLMGIFATTITTLIIEPSSPRKG